MSDTGHWQKALWLDDVSWVLRHNVQVVTRPDTDGRLLPMIKNMAGYAQGSGQMSAAGIEEILSTIEHALSEGSYLALAPQFVVTATR